MVDKMVVVFSTHRDGSSEQGRLEGKLLSELGRRPNVDLTVVPHLYDLAGDGQGMEFFRSVPGDMIVLAWLYPRAAYWVLDANGIRGRLGQTVSLLEDGPDESAAAPPDRDGVPERTIWCLDLRTHDRAESYVEEVMRIVATLVEPASLVTEPVPAEAAVGPSETPEAAPSRWYPVIDFGRCTNCLECLNFCLFGVFSVDDADAILIEQPDACRDGCPACSRICPAGAIMFPEHDDPGIAGDPDASLEGLKLDLSQLFGGANPLDMAAAERDRALAEKRHREAEKPQTNAGKPPVKDELDDLVDELDDLDL